MELWPLENIKPYPHNLRICTETAVAKVAASIRAFGWRQPIVVDEDGVILVGHTRRAAAELLRMRTAPVHQALGLSDVQKRAYRIADNRTNEETRWNEELLQFELESLQELDFDLSLTGFDRWQWPFDESTASDPEAEYASAGMPEFHQDDLLAWKTLKVHFRSLEDMMAFAELVGEKLTEETKSIWFPHDERIKTKDRMRYAAAQ